MSCVVVYKGRRHKVKLSSAHAPVHTIIAEATAHFGIEGAFGLRTTRGRRVDVDGSAPWAHTGLSNNCELELVAAAASGGGTVRVAASVRHRGSSPRSATFAVDSKATLEAVLARCAAEGAAPADILRRSPTVRILRDAFEGERLRTTLAAIGHGGGGGVRVNVDFGALDGGAPDAAPAAAPAAVVEKRPRDEPVAGAPVAEAPAAPAAAAPPADDPMDAAPTAAAAADALGDALAALGRAGPAQAAACAALLVRYVDGVLRAPRDPRVRAIRRGNAAFAARVAVTRGGAAVLGALGFAAEDRGGEAWLVLSDAGARDALALGRARDALASLAAAPAAGAAAAAFDPFSTVRIDMRRGARAAAPAGGAETTTERRARELSERASDLEGAAAPPRRDLRLRSGAAVAAAAAAPPAGAPDEAPGRGDAGVIARAAAARERSRREREDAPLTTKAMRDVAALEKLRVYDRCALQVHFPDRVVLDAAFHPREPLSAAYAVVRSVLSTDAPTFRLFVAPPKRDLPESAEETLSAAGLVPAAKVFVAWAAPPARPYLSPDARASLDRAPGDAAFPEAKAVVPAAAAAAGAAPAAAAAGGAAPKKKVPGWLKV